MFTAQAGVYLDNSLIMQFLPLRILQEKLYKIHMLLLVVLANLIALTILLSYLQQMNLEYISSIRIFIGKPGRP